MQPFGYGVADSSRLDATFLALADPTRRAILARLMQGEASVRELAEPFAMTQAAVSKHLRVLERAGLVKRGRRQVTIIDRPGLATASCECYQLVRERVAFHLPKTYA